MAARKHLRYGEPFDAEGMVEVTLQPPLLNPAVMQYMRPTQQIGTSNDWTSLPEIPTTNEILDRVSIEEQLRLLPNTLTGAWQDRDTYLASQYAFLREEAVRPLREVVSQLRNIPQADEDAFKDNVGIYEKTHIIGWLASTRGLAVHVTFSTRRAGKKILWQQAKRLMTGSLVALTPSDDMFQTTKKTIIATVAARPLFNLELNPPEIDLFIKAQDLEIDPSIEWTMVEARSSFFEAERYTMLAVQKLSSEPFPLAKHIVSLDAEIQAPQYIADTAAHNLTAVFGQETRYQAVEALKAWPKSEDISMDASQQSAVQRMYTNSLAIIQGPPGTGKTYVSVKTVQALLDNIPPMGPPIIVTAQTNHALDQLLRHIAEFESAFIRLGGRSKDKDVIMARTLFAVRNATEQTRLPGCSAPSARKEMRRLEKAIAELLAPLKLSHQALDPYLLVEYGILNAKQAISLENGANRWIQAKQKDASQAPSPFQVWAIRSMRKVPDKPEPEDFGFEYEEEELEFEELQDDEAENAIKDDDFVDALKGGSYTLADNFTCSKVPGVTEKMVKKLLDKHDDLWQVKEGLRGPIYRYLQAQLKIVLVSKFRDLAEQYDQQSRLFRIGQWENDELILRKQRVIGCTTTGLSKYRGLIAALGCKVVLVEEAAETLEAPVLAACLPTVEHLILVGDHKQLRPHCRVREHESSPLNYNISMFERLVDNNIGHVTLNKQRRMIPEIRRLLRPIYKDIITDHDFVKDKKNRPDVPGMGGINSYFFTHSWHEQRDDLMSCYNEDEARMVVGLTTHLIHNGMADKDITILTFYNGQRKRLLRLMRKSEKVRFDGCQVVTVDSYQGEENKVVILSLVRSNEFSSIGFLQNDNRVCVALSRAQQGFYLFGNGMLLNMFKTWRRIFRILCGQDDKHQDEVPSIEPQRFHQVLPITCSNHATRVEIEHPDDWVGLHGGCRKPCDWTFECGHSCQLLCHSSGHSSSSCTVPCPKVLACGHVCSQYCGQTCSCDVCSKAEAPRQLDVRDKSSGLSTTTSWHNFSAAEQERYERSARLMPRATTVDLVSEELDELLIEI